MPSDDARLSREQARSDVRGTRWVLPQRIKARNTEELFSATACYLRAGRFARGAAAGPPQLPLVHRPPSGFRISELG